jgi:hypothetical protein
MARDGTIIMRTPVPRRMPTLRLNEHPKWDADDSVVRYVFPRAEWTDAHT